MLFHLAGREFVVDSFIFWVLCGAVEEHQRNRKCHLHQERRVLHCAEGNKPALGPVEQNTSIWEWNDNHFDLIFFGEALPISLCLRELKLLQPKPKADLGVLKFPLAMQASVTSVHLQLLNALCCSLAYILAISFAFLIDLHPWGQSTRLRLLFPTQHLT